MKKLSIIVLIVVSLVLISIQAEARIYLDVYGKTYKKATIAVPPFTGEGGTGTSKEMVDLLQNDLTLSGFFIVAPSSLIDKELAAEGISRDQIRFASWRSIGVELICKGAVQVASDGGITLETYLYDSFEGATMLAKRYRGKGEDWRRMVHRLADDIIQAVTGEKGIMGMKVLFAAGSRNQREVYVADIDGHNLRKLTNQRNIVVSPSLSPDGKYLAYTSYKDGRPNLYVVEVDSGKEIFVDKEEGMKLGTGWISASTFGYAHTVGRFSTINTFNVGTRKKDVVMREQGILASPSFSSDGRKMVFVSDMYGNPQIFLRDLASGETKRLTYSGTYNTSPNFSPKGDLIAFVCRVEGSFEICVMNADGSDQRILTSGGLNDSPHFSPCGRYIIYSSNQGNRDQIYLMLYNGDNKKLLKYTDYNETQPRLTP
jgi:TolB protein